MASFELHVDRDLKAIEAAWNSTELIARRKDFTDSVADKMEPFVPMSAGGPKSHMRDRGNRSIGDGTIRYDADYSGYVYVMPDSTTNWTTPGTSGHWDEKFAEAEQDWLVHTAEELLMKGLE